MHNASNLLASYGLLDRKSTLSFLVATGAISGLDFKTAAKLLKTLELRTWDQFGMFMAVLALRIIPKNVFRREQEAYKILRTAGLAK